MNAPNCHPPLHLWWNCIFLHSLIALHPYIPIVGFITGAHLVGGFPSFPLHLFPGWPFSFVLRIRQLVFFPPKCYDPTWRRDFKSKHLCYRVGDGCVCVGGCSSKRCNPSTEARRQVDSRSLLVSVTTLANSRFSERLSQKNKVKEESVELSPALSVLWNSSQSIQAFPYGIAARRLKNKVH